MNTLVPTKRRMELACDDKVGFGNVLRVACEVCPNPDASYLVTDRAVCGVLGQPVTVLSLNELDALAQTWSCWYLDKGVQPRDRVAVYVEDAFDDLLHFFALSQIGAIPVLVNGGMPVEVVAEHCRHTGVTGIYTDRVHLERLAGLIEDLGWTQIAEDVRFDGARPLPVANRHSHEFDDPVLICHSSGTTGVPKPVIWTHGQAMTGVRAHLVRFVDRPDSRILSALPQSHGSAVGYVALAMLTGVPIAVQSDPSGASVAKGVDQHGATIVVAFASTYAELAALPPEAGSMSTVEHWVSVGDVSHRSHSKQLVKVGRHWVGGEAVPGSLFIDAFGSSELGWGGVLSQVTIQGTEARHRCIGQPQPFADVRVLRADGSEAEVDEVGLMGVKGMTVTPGYWNDSNTTYRSKLNGHWLSGDLVRRDRANRFYHVDRVVDAIETDEGTGYSVLMEEVLLEHFDEIGDCAVVAGRIDGRVKPVLVVRPRCDLREGLLARANEVLRAVGQPEIALMETVADLPTGVTGKVLKRLLREKYGMR